MQHLARAGWWAVSLGLAVVACGDDSPAATEAAAGSGGSASATGGSGPGSGGETSGSPSATQGASSTSGGTTTSSSSASSTGGGGSGSACGEGGPVGPADLDHVLPFGGDDRTYRVHVPPGYPDGGPYPVVLMFHGYLEDGAQFETISTMTPAADAAGYVVVYADGRSSSWNAGSCCGSSSALDVDDVGFVGAMIDQLLATYCLDERRVYAAGFSNGGMLSYRLACEMGERIAAIGSTAGTLGFDPCIPARPMPVMHTHGTDDFVVPWEGGGIGNALPVDETIATWLDRDGCTDVEPTTIEQNGDATCVAWTQCEEGSEVRLCTIDGGGHQWPGGTTAGPGGPLSDDLQTSEALLAFFDGHTLPDGGGGSPCDDPLDPDCDGIDQATEDQIADDYLPFISMHPDEECPRGGIVYRARPHPIDPTKVFITYVVLYESDCGFGGHVGDNEAFGVTIDPSLPAPAGFVSMKAIGHQNTACEQVTDCGTCEGSNPCDLLVRNGELYPVIFASENKHAGYAHDDCSFLCDNGGCAEAAAPAEFEMVNAGEPDAQLVNDLTTQGFITAANGWTEPSLFGFDPWAVGVDFGSAGSPQDDMEDPAFLPDCY